MESELAQAKAVARRRFFLRVVGLSSLIALIAFEDKQIAHGYFVLCMGCAMLQTAYLDYPNPARPDRFLLISPFELNNPKLHVSCFLGLKLLAIISLIIELFVGFNFLDWKSTLFILVVTTFGTDLMLTGLSRRYPLYLVVMLTGIIGLVLSIVAIFMF